MNSINNHINNLQPNDLVEYANLLGFSQVADNDRVMLFNYESTNKQLVIPKHSQYPDYLKVVSDFIFAVSDYEERDPFSIVDEISHLFSDKIKFILDDETTKDGRIPIDKGIDLFEGAKKALLASACSIINKRPYHSKLSVKSSQAYLERCSIGQTEVGSYVVNFVCPLFNVDDEPYNLNQIEFFEGSNVPFSRRVNLQLIESLNTLLISLNNNHFERILNPNDDQFLISSNLCDAIGMMEPASLNSDLKVKVNWALKKPNTLHIDSDVIIPKVYFGQIKELAEELKPKFERIPDQFVGKVEILRGEEMDGLRSGEVLIKTTYENEGINLHVELSPDDYQLACDAHKFSNEIQITGELDREGRKYVLINYSGFGLIH